MRQHLEPSEETEPTEAPEARDSGLVERVAVLESLVSAQREVLLEILRWFKEARRV